MQDILKNIALLDTMRVCVQNNIDTSGTHIYKYPRVFKYALCTQYNEPLVTITYYKKQIPLIQIIK